MVIHKIYLTVKDFNLEITESVMKDFWETHNMHNLIKDPVTAWKVSKYGVFLVRIIPHSDWIRRDTEYVSVFSPNAGKYRPEKNSVFGNFLGSEYVLKPW